MTMRPLPAVGDLVRVVAPASVTARCVHSLADMKTLPALAFTVLVLVAACAGRSDPGGVEAALLTDAAAPDALAPAASAAPDARAAAPDAAPDAPACGPCVAPYANAHTFCDARGACAWACDDGWTLESGFGWVACTRPVDADAGR